MDPVSTVKLEQDKIPQDAVKLEPLSDANISGNSGIPFCWRKFLSTNSNHDIVPVKVSCFHHAPLSMMWSRIEQPGVTVEYRLGKVKTRKAEYMNVHWIGTTVAFFGYLVKVEPLGYKKFKDTPSRWLNFMRDCQRVGTCSKIDGATLIPPLDILETVQDWRKKIIEEVRGTISMHQDVPKIIQRNNQNRISIGCEIEVLDNLCVSRMKLARVDKNIGQRVYVRYWDDQDDSDVKGFWCHEASGLLRPKGWSKTIGHFISSPPGYKPSTIPLDLFLERSDPEISIEVGMKLEAVDPLNPSQVSAATVTKVLNHGFMMVSFNEVSKETLQTELAENVEHHGNDWYCFHVSSHLIFRCGFSKQWGINLVPPKELGNSTEFEWDEYFSKTGTKPLDLKSSRLSHLKHEFSVGQKLEAVDLIEPFLVCLATVADVKGRLLMIHFDGWSDDYNQWMDVRSHDIYPVGWCDFFEYPLQGPNDPSFWEKYKKPDESMKDLLSLNEFEEYKPKRRAADNHRYIPNLRATKDSKELVTEKQRPQKRKLSDLPVVTFDHEKVKAEAFKLGATKPKSIKSTVEELRQKLNKAPGPKKLKAMSQTEV